MRNNLGIILGMSLAMESCQKTTVTGMKDCVEQLPKEKKNTYTEFVPNPENNQYKRKVLGVKKRGYKK